MSLSSFSKYSRAIIYMHWFMLFLIVGTYLFIEFRVIFPKGTDARTLMKVAHFSLGLTVLLCVSIRVYLKLSAQQPNSHLSFAARLGHVGLYFYLMIMPILGWLVVSAEGKEVTFYFFTLPPLIAENADLAHDIEEWHEILGELGYWLIGGHALMALYHHYFKNDPTFRRMIP